MTIKRVEIGDDGVVLFFNDKDEVIKMTENQKQTALLAQIWSTQYSGMRMAAVMEAAAGGYEGGKLDS